MDKIGIEADGQYWQMDQVCTKINIAAFDRYERHGIPTGSFLMFVLQNNLKEALGAADMNNTANIAAIVGYCYNNLPSNIWGSPEEVQQHLDSFKEKEEEVE